MVDLDFLGAAVKEVTSKRELRGEDDVAVGGASSTAASSGGGGASNARASPAKRHRRGVLLSPMTEWDPSPVKRDGLEDQMGLVDCKVLALSEVELPFPGCSRHMGPRQDRPVVQRLPHLLGDRVQPRTHTGPVQQVAPRALELREMGI